MLLPGAAGDLSTRYIMPALAHLHENDLLPDGFEVTGIGRRDWDDQDFREFVKKRLDAKDVEEKARRELLESLTYRTADITKRDQMQDAIGGSSEPVLAYLALPPGIFPPAMQALSGMPDGSRIVVEKPFGEDLSSARKLNELLHESFEEDVFRADHFLGMKSLRDVFALRFANSVFGAAWSGENIERVEIVWDETLALEGRASYYDGAGALKDLIQNHLLQTLCMLAMDAKDFRDKKVELLRSVKKLSPEEVERQSVRARYSSGSIDGREVSAYTREDGVNPSRDTETFAEITLRIDDERWSGTPFTLRTGKALAENRQEIRAHFGETSGSPFEDGEANVLALPFAGDGLYLTINTAADGNARYLSRAELAAKFAEQKLPAYGHLLLRALRGDPAFFVRGDEAEESWRVVEPILEAWKEG
ncbi:MAG: glucose-6-phosphate dehydrogenase, partial [Rubrobacteraceae bacterium]